uniref:Uncharacterized protein n=1 Tax=Rhizophora mucronata TaxID=61149 RepID=A0A2P2N2J8_RHIMU
MQDQHSFTFLAFCFISFPNSKLISYLQC